MKKLKIATRSKKMLADIFTPVGIYLRLRDRFRDTILLESTDHHAAENSYSFICINAIGGIEISANGDMECKYPTDQPVKIPSGKTAVADELWRFMQGFEIIESGSREEKFAQGLYGYTAYDAVRFFEQVQLKNNNTSAIQSIPVIRYRLYQYVIVINHFKDELILCENLVAGLESQVDYIESLIKSRDVPQFPFVAVGEETSNVTDEQYREMVRQGINACKVGNVFQIVLSRQFNQRYTGDDFNVYRALRSINPSPYLFYFDYGDYKLMGSSPEAQLIIDGNTAIVHPIAGTFKRSGDQETDQQMTQKLLADTKENAEHVMLVDLARNDLSRLCDQVEVARFREVQYYSHVIHLVSEVRGKLKSPYNAFEMLAKTFPAGTLSGAPKIKAMELIDSIEPVSRGYYGGAIGFMGFDGRCNQAIMIRSFLSRNNTLTCQAGAGVVVASDPEMELQEVNNKLNALKKAIVLAEAIGQ